MNPQLTEGVAAKLLTCWFLERFRDQHPDISFLTRLNLATTAATHILDLQPFPFTKEFADNLCRLVTGNMDPELPAGPQKLPRDSESAQLGDNGSN